jgi:putative SOS response-associated peptidase YedK
LRARPEAIAEHFELDEIPETTARHNIAPGQAIAAVRANTDDGRVCEMRSWGLVPGWAKEPSIGNRMINARAETAAEKPSFRSAFARRRCLIPADGFYEWAAGSTPKQPYLISRRDDGLFAFAGLWEDWEGEDGAVVRSCTILTTAANATLSTIHARMPVILDPADYAVWLSPAERDADARTALLAPCPEPWLRLQTVGLRVNNARRDDPACSLPAPAQPSQRSLL